MSKRLTKTIWYGSGVDSNGNPILPSTHGGLDGLNYGELYLHLSNGKATLWTLSSDGKIVEITGGGSEVDMSSYLLKSIWDKVWEIRTDSQGAEYIFGKLPVVTQYGITMYSGDGVDVPSLASGLPFDGRTIWYNPDTQQIEVIGGTGGGSGEGVSNFWDLSGIPSWITNSKPKYTYSEIEGTPDLSGFATQNWIISQGYASAEELKKYIPISGYTEVSGEKNFTGGLKVNGSPISYDTEKKYWKLEGDLLVTGGVTMYGSDSSFTPSTIMDAILYDDATLGINSNGQLYVKGGTSGGGLDITALQNYLTSNSYLNVTSGDNRYLQLSGGTLTGNILLGGTTTNKIGTNIVDTSGGFQEFTHQNSNGYIALGPFNGSVAHIYTDRPSFYFNKDLYVNDAKVWHAGNDGSGSGLDADLLDGLHSSSFVRQYGISQNANEALNAGTYRFHETKNGLPDVATNYGVLFTAREDGYDTLWQLYGNYNNDGLFYRRGNNTGISDNSWKQIAFTDSNVASATKLQTARTIWGQSFDGTGNVSGVIGDLSVIIFDTSNGGSNIGYLWTNARGMHMDMSGLGTELQGTNLTLTPFGNVGVGTANPLYKHHVVGDSYIQGVSYVANYISFDYKDHSINNESAGRLGTFDRRGGMVLQFGTNTSYRRFSIIDQPWTVELFYVDDSGNVFANGGITMYSDQRKKTILNHVELSLKQIANAPLIEHYYNSDDKKTTHVGSIAQYWANMNDWFCKLDSEGYYTMEIQNAALASAISIARELDRYETKTDKAIKKLKKRICELEEEVERLKSA